MKTYQKIIIIGFLWGFSEIFLGTILHLFEGFAGYILFAIGFYLMLKVYRDTGRLSSIFYCGVIAATMKLATFFIYPPSMLIYVIKPAAFILLESVCVTGITFLFGYIGRVFERWFRQV
jgi:hypothetical protein